VVIENAVSRRPRLIVIDDERGFCEFVSEVAADSGFEPHVATDTSDIAQLLTREPSVIVLDLSMPDKDGIEILRELALAKCRAQLIFTSGLDSRIIDSAARTAKAHGFRVAAQLQKPIRASVLIGLFEGLLHAPADAPGMRRDGYVPSIEELRHALQSDQLIVHWQPQVALADGAWVGIEALVRWQHPTQGMLPPDAFVGLAEANGLGLELTYRVLEHALRQCRTFAADGFDGVLSVNVPAVALRDVHFPEQVQRRKEAEGDWPKLCFEVTETSVSTELVSALDILTRLRMRGVGLSIDDFGTGHSGLERLYQLPFTELKIDMQFVRAAEHDASARTIVENSTSLAHKLGMKVVAEGVENLALWHWLRQIGCDVAQGYFVSKPLPADQIIRWRKEWCAP